MTAQAPTDADLLALCEAMINGHPIPSEYARKVARALRSRLSPQTLQENTPHATAVPVPACPSTLRTSGEQPPLSPVGPHLGPEWLEEILKRDAEVWKEKAAGLVWGGLVLEFGYDAIADRATLLAQVRKATLGWRGIEDAPRDGSAFLAASRNWITVCCWHRPQQVWCAVGPVYSPYPHDEQPTHFMPLPSPPSAEG